MRRYWILICTAVVLLTGIISFSLFSLVGGKVFNPFSETKGKTEFRDGTFVVGTDVAPGLYKNREATSCYFARLRGFHSTLEDVIANGNPGSSQAIVAIEASDKGFESENCGVWTRIGDAASAPSGPAPTNHSSFKVSASSSCNDFTSAYDGGVASDFSEYASNVYVQLDMQRVASGKSSVGVPEINNNTFDYWRKICSADPNTPFYNVVRASYAEYVTMACLFGCK